MNKSVVRSMKNVTKGYSTIQKKVRDATSNDAWGPTGTQMSEIAQMTFLDSHTFYEVMANAPNDVLDKRLNDKGKNWKHVLKSLKACSPPAHGLPPPLNIAQVLDYCLHEGSELVVTWARKNIFVVKTLREFQYIDEDARDVGQNVRVSAKELTSLLLDEERLRAERSDRKLWKSRVTGLDDFGPSSAGGYDPPRSRRPTRSNKSKEDDDLEYKLALEASKNEEEADRMRRAGAARPVVDDDDLAKAIKLSKEEEDLRRRELEESNASSLFDDTPAQQPQTTGWNQGYQQQGAVDWFGNPVEQQQPQSTGYLNNAYAQPTGIQSQQTSFQNGYGYGAYQQPQQTGFDQSQFQQSQPVMQPQPTAFGVNNPYSQQTHGFEQNQSQPIQQPNTLQPGSNNPWGSNADAADNLKPQQTGSNNPFASSVPRPQTSQAQRFPTLNTLQEQRAKTQFSQPFSQSQTFASQQSAQAQQEQNPNPHHANLNAILSSGEGQDTFGNVGNLRIPAQHTAPGTFINSSGSGLNRLQATQTGTNPFMQTHFTGMPAHAQMVPAQTGPAGGYGAVGLSSANPFGAQQRQGAQPQSGSLIDL